MPSSEMHVLSPLPLLPSVHLGSHSGLPCKYVFTTVFYALNTVYRLSKYQGRVKAYRQYTTGTRVEFMHVRILVKLSATVSIDLATETFKFLNHYVFKLKIKFGLLEE